MNERSQIRITNGSFSQRMIVTGLALTVLFTVMAPQSSAPLTAAPRFIFWCLHIGLGLATATLAARMLLKLAPGIRDWRLVLLSGLAGVTLFAPFALALESFFPVLSAAADNDWADRLAATSLPAAVSVEAMEMAPSYLAAWALINLHPVADAWQRRSASAPRLPQDRAPSERAFDTATTVHLERQPQSESQSDNAFVQRLPPAVGRDVIAVTSDLHYLQVVTRDGQATVLGALKEVEEAFGERGLRVHRSHWVCKDAVVRLRKAGSGWFLELDGGYRVPISRRKRGDVVAHLGEDFVRAAKAV